MLGDGCRLCVMVLCGLPASGKSSLAQLLASSGASERDKETAKNHLSFIIVEYDKLLPADVEKQLIEEGTYASEGIGQDQSAWKQYRSDVYQCVDAVIEKLKYADTPQLSDVLKPTGVSSEVWARFEDNVISQLLDKRVTEGDNLCVVIDDNMYYHSMRYRYYQMARKYTIGFCQIYLECDMSTAVARNANRNLPVSEEVLVNIATKVEAPDIKTNAWENLSLFLTTENICIQGIHHLVQQALENPIMPVEKVDEECLNQSREICSSSFLHQSDQILRRLVSQEMASAKKKNLTKAEMKEFASKIQARRKDVLDGFKSGQITVPSATLSLATDSSKDQDSVVYEFVQNLFMCHQDMR